MSMYIYTYVMASSPSLPEPPLIGYKMVMLPNGVHAIVKLNIPKDAKVFRTGYKVNFRGQADPMAGNWLYRTGRAQPIRISPVNRPGDVATVGMSLRDPTVKYELGKWMDMYVDAVAAKGPGIHFFLDEADAKMWPVLFKR